MRVTLSKAAENDLEAIGDWIAQENPARARSFIAELRLDCLDLAHFPERNA
ncbi:MAG: type II toxin-antitoxin system RelE/ParE family toxin, partial [Hyphomicrobiales bacterium]